MTIETRTPQPRVRRRNEHRSAETQGRLIEATINCLNRVGYASTTTILVSDVSGVTRGGMLHHYPTKVDLMIATAEHCLMVMRDQRLATVEGTGPTRGTPTPRAIMEIERGRFGVALTEIMLGSRSDEQLAARFKPVGDIILANQRRAAARIANNEGIADVRAVEAMVWLNMAGIRGMTLMGLAGIDPGLTDMALELIAENRKAFLARLKTRQKAAGGSAPHEPHDEADD